MPVTYLSPSVDKPLKPQLKDTIEKYSQFGTHEETKAAAKEFLKNIDQKDELALLLEVTKEAIKNGKFAGSGTFAPKLKEFAKEFAIKYQHDFKNNPSENIVKCFVAYFLNYFLLLDKKWFSESELAASYESIIKFITKFQDKEASASQLYEYFIFELHFNPALAACDELHKELSTFIHIYYAKPPKIQLIERISSYMFENALINKPSVYTRNALTFVETQRQLETKDDLQASIKNSYEQLFKGIDSVEFGLFSLVNTKETNNFDFALLSQLDTSELRLIDIALKFIIAAKKNEDESFTLSLAVFVRAECETFHRHFMIKPSTIFIVGICSYLVDTRISNRNGHQICFSTLSYLLNKLKTANEKYLLTKTNDNASIVTNDLEKMLNLEWKTALLEEVSKKEGEGVLKNSKHLRNNMIDALARVTRTNYGTPDIETISAQEKCRMIRERITELQTPLSFNHSTDVQENRPLATLKDEIRKILQEFQDRRKYVKDFKSVCSVTEANAYAKSLSDKPDNELLLLLDLAEAATGLGALNQDKTLSNALRNLIQTYINKFNLNTIETDRVHNVVTVFLSYLIKPRAFNASWEPKKQIAFKFIAKLINSHSADDTIGFMFIEELTKAICAKGDLTDCRELTANLHLFITDNYAPIVSRESLSGKIFANILIYIFENDLDKTATENLLEQMHILIASDKRVLIKSALTQINIFWEKDDKNQPEHSVDLTVLFNQLESETLRLLLIVLTTINPNIKEHDLAKSLGKLAVTTCNDFYNKFLAKIQPQHTIMLALMRDLISESTIKTKVDTLNYLITLLQRQHNITEEYEPAKDNNKESKFTEDHNNNEGLNSIDDVNNNNANIPSDKVKIERWLKSILEDITPRDTNKKQPSSSVQENSRLCQFLAGHLLAINGYFYSDNSNISKDCTILKELMDSIPLKIIKETTNIDQDAFLSNAAKSSYTPSLFWKREETSSVDASYRQMVSPFSSKK